MLVVEDGEIKQFRRSCIGQFFNILALQFKRYNYEVKVLVGEYGELPSKEVIDDRFPELYDRQVVATVFSGMIVEAYLYDFACVVKSKSFAERVSRKSLEQEFISIAELLSVRDFKREEKVKNGLSLLRESRVFYVHNKSTPIEKDFAGGVKFLSIAECLEVMGSIFEYMFKSNCDYKLSGVLLFALQELHMQERGYELAW